MRKDSETQERNWLDKTPSLGYGGINTCLRVRSVEQRGNPVLQQEAAKNQMPIDLFLLYIYIQTGACLYIGKRQRYSRSGSAFKEQINEEGKLCDGDGNKWVINYLTESRVCYR